MSYKIKKIFISDGREVGGVRSFSLALREGFEFLGFEVEVFSSVSLIRCWRDFRSEDVLFILSTSSLIYAPLIKRSLCVAHGFPRIDAQGLLKTILILVSLKFGEVFSTLVAVSRYASVHLSAIYCINSRFVIHNPVRFAYSKSIQSDYSRNSVTYIGRLNKVKNVSSILDSIKQVAIDYPWMNVWIVGTGKERDSLIESCAGLKYINFVEEMQPDEITVLLRKTKLFISMCETEGFGITYLEALSLGCNVLMPTSGAGVEIAPELIGNKIFLSEYPVSIQRLRTALDAECMQNVFQKSRFSPEYIAIEYLNAANSGVM